MNTDFLLSSLSSSLSTVPAGLFIFSFTQYGFVHFMGPMVGKSTLFFLLSSRFLVLTRFSAHSSRAHPRRHLSHFQRNLMSSTPSKELKLTHLHPQATYNFTADAYPEYASSAIAGQGLLRNMFGASTPLFANYMLTRMGLQYGCLLLSCVASLAIPLPYILFKYGAKLREKSKYAANEDELEDQRQTDDNDAINARPKVAREATYTAGLV